MPEVAVGPDHVEVATVEAQVVRDQSIAPERRRTPIDAIASGEAERRPETPTGGRKKDAVTVGTGHLVAVMATLSRPLPVALVYQFL